MKIVPFQTEHLDELTNFGNQEEIIRPFVGLLQEAHYEKLGPAFSASVDGRIIGCAGLVEMTQYRAYTWAIMAKQDFAQRFIGIHRAVLRFLDEQTYKRMDAQVAINDADGHRWMKLLGFQREVFCRAWAMPDGSAVSEYVRWG